MNQPNICLKELEQSQINLLRLTLDLVKQTNSLTNQQLLRTLGQRIATGEIKSDANHDYLYVANERFHKIITLVIETGKIKMNKEVSHE